jgi:hypothetical protein
MSRRKRDDGYGKDYNLLKNLMTLYKVICLKLQNMGIVKGAELSRSRQKLKTG